MEKLYLLEELGRLNEVGGANDYRYANRTHCTAHTTISVSKQPYRGRGSRATVMLTEKVSKSPYLQITE